MREYEVQFRGQTFRVEAENETLAMAQVKRQLSRKPDPGDQLVYARHALGHLREIRTILERVGLAEVLARLDVTIKRLQQDVTRMSAGEGGDQ